MYKGIGNMFQAFDFDYTWCIIAIAMLSAVYLFAGGIGHGSTDFIRA